jgi:hypothetical protein
MLRRLMLWCFFRLLRLFKLPAFSDFAFALQQAKLKPLG